MSPLVLIADADTARGKEIAEACAARGLETHVTSHGAAALEAALAELPGVLVAQIGLPLIDGPQLAAILHANPRTQGIRALYVGGPEPEGDGAEIDGELVAEPGSASAIAHCAASLLAQRGEADAPQSAAVDGEQGVEGQLSQLSLAELLQLFHVSRKTGTVELVRRDNGSRPEFGTVLLRGGEVVHAVAGRAVGEKALYRLLAWDRGSFAFRPGPVVVDPTVQAPTRSLLREGERQLEEWQRTAVDLPSRDAHVSLQIERAALPNVLHPLTQEVLLVLEVYSRVQDVLDHCTYPDYQVLRTLHTLVARGMLALRRSPPAGLASDARLFSPRRAARLREWLEGSRPRGGVVRDAKLLVFASDPGATREFARLVEPLPGARIESAAGGEIAARDLAPIGRLAIDGELGVELVQAPADPRFAPLWPIVGHGALAAVFLLAGPVGPAVATLRLACEAMRQLPRARLFHVLLLDKGERIEPEALRENLSLLDEGSLFLVPLENREKAGGLLRELFGRILP